MPLVSSLEAMTTSTILRTVSLPACVCRQVRKELEKLQLVILMQKDTNISILFIVFKYQGKIMRVVLNIKIILLNFVG